MVRVLGGRAIARGEKGRNRIGAGGDGNARVVAQKRERGVRRGRRGKGDEMSAATRTATVPT